MRLGFAASGISLCVLGFAVQSAMTRTSAQATAPAAAIPAAATPAAATPAATTPAATTVNPAPAGPAAGDAAAKHAKRTVCLQDAKTKKLVGAEKTAFLKDCLAAP
jgi:hypothetical protein